jgi:SAM-dependent methyltransferase
MNRIFYYSQKQNVSMADSWFDVANLDHFWVKRRFTVFQKLLGKKFLPSTPVCEIGCGNGLVQAQFFQSYGVMVDGFDLNELALSKSVAESQPKYLYDIHDRKSDLRHKYKLIMLFDIIEHIDDDSAFLESVLFHLNSGGVLVVNVPALQFLYSNYDRAAGHVRRYSLPQLEKLGRLKGLQLVKGTYWGLPMLPLLTIRKGLLAFESGEKEIIQRGFKPPSALANYFLNFLCKLEPIPQRLLGTSTMCIFKKL